MRSTVLTIKILPSRASYNSYAAANALTFVGGSVRGPAVVASDYQINDLQSAIDNKLIARAPVVYSSKTQAACRCDADVIGEGKENFCVVV